MKASACRQGGILSEHLQPGETLQHSVLNLKRVALIMILWTLHAVTPHRLWSDGVPAYRQADRVVSKS